MSSSDFGRAGANYVRRDVGAGGAGGVMLPPDFNRSANLISPSGANYTLHITTAPPGFPELRTALLYVQCCT